MKKRGLLLGILVACLLLAGCTQKAAETPLKACAEVLAAIEASQTFEEMTALSDQQTLKYLDLNESLLSDSAMSMDASRATAEGIVVLTATDAENLKQAQQALEAYRDVTLEQYRDYRPDEVPKLENAVLQTKGLQTVLIVSKDAAAAKTALETAWK